MYRIALLVLLFTAAAHGAAAQSKPRVKAPPVAAQKLRGPVAAPTVSLPPPRTAIEYGARSLFLPSPVVSAPVGGAPQQCRLSCAQTYYFCLASDHSQECSASWGQCRSGCDTQTLPTSY